MRQPPFLLDDWAAVIERSAVEVDWRLVLHQVRMHGIAAGEHAARDQTTSPTFSDRTVPRRAAS